MKNSERTLALSNNLVVITTPDLVADIRILRNAKAPGSQTHYKILPLEEIPFYSKKNVCDLILASSYYLEHVDGLSSQAVEYWNSVYDILTWAKVSNLQVQ